MAKDAKDTASEGQAPPEGKGAKGLTAEEMAKEFKEHSVAEFFKKNMQMLGLTGKIKTLTTIVHEYVTNSVTGDTPTVIRKDGEVRVERIGALIDGLMTKNGFEYSKKNDAESLRDFQKFEALCFDKQTNKMKFKQVQSIHRHRMAPGEKIFKIKNHREKNSGSHQAPRPVQPQKRENS